MKIQAHELRIGNWIQCKPRKSDKKWRYVQVDADIIKKIADNNAEYMEYKPIVISEKILLKAGFEKRGENGYWTAYITYNGWTLCKSNHDNNCLFVKKNRFYFGDNFTEFRHLHLLQNCFWALTTKELSIEL